MNRSIRAAVAAAAAIAILPFMAACGSSGQGTAERSTAAEKAADDGKDAASTAEPAEEEPEQPDTELKVGDGFRYNDGVKVTVTKIRKLKTADYGEYDSRPEADQTAFRVQWDIANGTSKPLDLESWGYDAKGASTGGTTNMVSAENGAKQMAGRLAPGKTASFTFEYSLAKSDGTEVVFTMSRLDDSVDLMSKSPNWTGTIE